MIYVFFANGFEEVEAVATVDMLRRAELEVCTVGVGGVKVAGAHGIVMDCDLADTQAHADEALEAVVLPGGMPGTLNLENRRSCSSLSTMLLRMASWLPQSAPPLRSSAIRGCWRGKRPPASLAWSRSFMARNSATVLFAGMGSLSPGAARA